MTLTYKSHSLNRETLLVLRVVAQYIQNSRKLIIIGVICTPCVMFSQAIFQKKHFLCLLCKLDRED